MNEFLHTFLRVSLVFSSCRLQHGDGRQEKGSEVLELKQTLLEVWSSGGPPSLSRPPPSILGAVELGKGGQGSGESPK